MNQKRTIRVSRFLSRHLRHTPEQIGLVLGTGGWVAIDALLAATARAGFPITRAELDHVVRTNDKQRFAIDDTGTRIRANQGHSVEVDLGPEPTDPPAELYHGTADRHLDAIRRDGLMKMNRHHVHLSADVPTATKVGQRHGRSVVFVIDAAKMRADGHLFFRSANGVWLVEHVPPQYLRQL